MVILKKDLIIAILTTFCLTSLLFTVIPIRSTPTPGGYDPWIDTNDDGIINYEDLFNFAIIYGTSGTPVNKTDLLLQLQSKIDSLNASLLDLGARVEALEAPESVTTDKIADYAVTNSKLAARTIPFNVTSYTGIDDTNSTTFEDMPRMSVDITLTRNSTLIIMFSTKAWVSTGSYYVYLTAFVNATQANPVSTSIALTAETMPSLFSYTFYHLNVVAGTYTVKIQWKVSDSSTTARVRERTLIVIALPA